MMALADHSLHPTRPPPAGYPSVATGTNFAEEPYGDFDSRRRELLAHLAATPAPPFMKAPYHELGRMAAGATPHAGVFEAALDFIDARRDCSDFLVHAVLRWLLQYSSHPELAPLEPRARETLLRFKYWPDEPGVDSMCSWTENHQILFAVAAFVLAERMPEATFSNAGWSGREQMRRHRPRIERWLELRFRTGFSEWLSHVYYDEDIAALLTLIDFSADDDLVRRATMVLDLLLLDIALNQFRGVFGSTHGRSYEPAKKWARLESTSDLQRLAFGTGAFGNPDAMSAVCLALSERYRMPPVIAAIAADPQPLRNRQRHGIRIAEAERWGLRLDDLEDGMRLLSLEAYAHPRTIGLVLRLFDAFGWWSNEFFAPFARRRGLLTWLRRLRLLPMVARRFERDLTRNTREEVDIVTYRTPDYMLSSAPDYRFGYGGDQQHLWQATLGPDAVCFTTHPGREPDTAAFSSPGYWTGSGTLPRVAQCDNVVIALYEIEATASLYVRNRLFFTHAWLPRDRFDEVIEREGWIFVRRRDGYLALRSRQPLRWQQSPGEDEGRELIAEGAGNIWLCELGRREEDGPFADFTARIVAAPIVWGEGSVVYDSPSQGRLEWQRSGPFRRNGEKVPLREFPRYENRYINASFPSERLRIEASGLSLELNWRQASRELG